jgi:alkanesulfonate monooxygenase SsuD/methylene tetrahydromethanopterin reductase-like flavin-dependent oxidoreductase (luciferase family)
MEPQALNRAVKFGDGWLPAEGDPEKLRGPVASLVEQMKEAGKAAPDVIPLTGLPLDDLEAAADRLAALKEIGVTGVNHAGKYENVDEFKAIVENLLELRSR